MRRRRLSVIAILLSLIAIVLSITSLVSNYKISNVETLETHSISIETPAVDDIVEVVSLDEPIVVADTANITFKVTSVIYNKVWENYTLKVFLENKTDEKLMFSLREVSINDYMCDPYWCVDVGAGKKANVEVSWYEPVIAENGFGYEDIEEIEFILDACAYDEDWNAVYYCDNFYTLKFN